VSTGLAGGLRVAPLARARPYTGAVSLSLSLSHSLSPHHPAASCRAAAASPPISGRETGTPPCVVRSVGGLGTLLTHATSFAGGDTTFPKCRQACGAYPCDAPPSPRLATGVHHVKCIGQIRSVQVDRVLALRSLRHGLGYREHSSERDRQGTSRGGCYRSITHLPSHTRFGGSVFDRAGSNRAAPSDTIRPASLQLRTNEEEEEVAPRPCSIAN
jgi:hypothetical protein